MMNVKHRSFAKHSLHLMVLLLLIMTGDDGCNDCCLNVMVDGEFDKTEVGMPYLQY